VHGCSFATAAGIVKFAESFHPSGYPLGRNMNVGKLAGLIGGSGPAQLVVLLDIERLSSRSADK